MKTKSKRCEMYVSCPYCNKKLFRITNESVYKNIYVWCKNCKKEIEVTKRAFEPITK